MFSRSRSAIAPEQMLLGRHLSLFFAKVSAHRLFRATRNSSETSKKQILSGIFQKVSALCSFSLAAGFLSARLQSPPRKNAAVQTCNEPAKGRYAVFTALLQGPPRKNAAGRTCNESAKGRRAAFTALFRSLLRACAQLRAVLRGARPPSP